MNTEKCLELLKTVGVYGLYEPDGCLCDKCMNGMEQLGGEPIRDTHGFSSIAISLPDIREPWPS